MMTPAHDPLLAQLIENISPPDRAVARRSLFARVENVLRTAGHADLADAFVEHNPSPVDPHGFVEALRSHAQNIRQLGFPGTGSSLEDTATRLARSVPSVRSALLCAWRCARAGAW